MDELRQIKIKPIHCFILLGQTDPWQKLIYTYCKFNFNCKIVSRFKIEKNLAMRQAPWSFAKHVSLMVLIGLQGFDMLRSTQSSCVSVCQRQTYWGPEILWEVRFGTSKGIPGKSLLSIDRMFEAWLIPGEVGLSWAFCARKPPINRGKMLLRPVHLNQFGSAPG